MTITTNKLYKADSKHILWDLLKTEFEALQVAFPTKVSVLVLKQYPKTMEQLDKYSAVITVARITAPQEMLFVGDNLNAGINDDNFWSKTKGSFNTDYYEVSIWSFDPDYRDQMYYIIRQLLLEKRQSLLEQGFIKVIRTGGGDQEVDLVAQPRIIYRATQIYMTQSRMTQESIYDLVSEIDINQTVRTEINSETNEITEIKIAN